MNLFDQALTQQGKSPSAESAKASTAPGNLFDEALTSRASAPVPGNLFDEALTFPGAATSQNLFDQALSSQRPMGYPQPVPLGRDAVTTTGDDPIADSLTRVLKTSGGAAMRALEVMDRPRSMIVSGIGAAQGNRPAGDIWQAAMGNIHPSYAEVLPEMVTHDRGSNFLGASGRQIRGDQSPDFVRHSIKGEVGFLADMFLDPINLVGLGVLTRAGKQGKVLANLATAHADNLGFLLNTDKLDDIVGAIQKRSPVVMEYLKGQNVADDVIETAAQAADALAPTLAEQAQKGQWATGKLGAFGKAVHTPQKVNVAVAKGLDKLNHWLPQTTLGRMFINRSGDELYDEAATAMQTEGRRAQNDILDKMAQLQDMADNLPREAITEQRLYSVSDLFSDGDTTPTLEQIPSGLMDSSKSQQARALAAQLPQDLRGKTLREIAGTLPESPGERQILSDILDIFDPNDTAGRKAIMFNYEKGNASAFPEVQALFDHTRNLLQDQSRRMKQAGLAFNEITSTEYFPHVRANDDIATRLDDVMAQARQQRLAEPVTQSSVTQAAPVAPSALPDDLVVVPEVQDPEGFLPKMLKKVFGNAESTKSGHQLHRNIKWVTDPQTGREVLTDVDLLSSRLGVSPSALKTRHAAPREINRALGKKIFDEDLVQSLLAAQLENERAIFGSRLVDWQLDEAVADLALRAGKVPTLADVPLPKIQQGQKVFVPGPKTHGTRFGRIHSVNAETGMAKVHFRKGGSNTFDEIPLSQLMDVNTIKEAVPGERMVRPTLEIPTVFRTAGETSGIEQLAKELREIPMAPEKARVFEGIWKGYVQPKQTLNQLDKMFKTYTSLWKRYTLFPFMEYHVRNVVGDLWNGWLQGWQPNEMIHDLLTAKDIQLGKKSYNLSLPIYGKIDGDKLFRIAQDHGVVGTGQYGELGKDLFAGFKSKDGGKIAQGLKSELVDLATPMKVGEFLEDNRRFGLFVRRLKKGDTFADAAKAVAKSLFDYNDLTEVERGIRTYAIPFYTWFRKNMPFQAEMMIRHPGKFAALPKAKAYIEARAGTDIAEEDRPEWMRQGFSIHTGQDPSGHEQMALLQNWIPSVDVLDYQPTLSGTVRALVSGMNPLFKIPIEQGLNRDFYFGNPIDFLDSTDSLNPFPLTGNERTNYLGHNISTRAKKWSELLPFTRLLSTADRLNPGGIFDMPDDYDPVKWSDDQIKTRPGHTEMDSLSKLVKAISGLKVYPVDVQRQMAFAMGDLQRSDKAPGLTMDNLRRMLRRAIMEDDKKSQEIYMGLIEDLQAEMQRKMERYDRYEEQRSQLP